jgi:hypothetical protein
MFKRLTTISRVPLGLVFLVFGFDGVFHFIPLPPMPPGSERLHLSVGLMLVAMLLLQIVRHRESFRGLWARNAAAGGCL